MKFDIYEHSDLCVASDTDSCFFQATPQLKKRLGDNFRELEQGIIINETRKIAEENAKKINSYLNILSKELFNVEDNQIEFKTETIIRSAYWAGKRRYAQYIVDKEGAAVSEYDMKGLDLMKSNFPPYFKDFGEQLIKDILTGKPKQEIDKNVMDFRNSVNTVDWKMLVKPSGLKKIDEYIEAPPQSGDIFSKLKIKCPQNTRASIVTNDLLRFYKLDKQYPCFTIGDKINTIILKNNPYKIDVIGLNGYSDAPQILKIAEEFIDKEGLFDSIIRNKLENIYADLGWSLQLNKFAKKFDVFEI